MKLSELFKTPFKVKGGGVLNLRGFSKRVVDKEIGGSGEGFSDNLYPELDSSQFNFPTYISKNHHLVTDAAEKQFIENIWNKTYTFEKDQFIILSDNIIENDWWAAKTIDNYIYLYHPREPLDAYDCVYIMTLNHSTIYKVMDSNAMKPVIVEGGGLIDPAN